MELSNQKKASRRGFLGVIASGATAFGLATVTSPIKASGLTSPFTPHSDVENWLDKIKGKHKIVFDAPKYNEGMPLAFPRVFQITNNNNGTPNNELGIVVVIRHDALPLALKSDIWTKYKLGEIFTINDHATNQPSVRNFFWKPKAGELEIPGMAINELQDSGVLFCVCEMAIFHYSGVVAKKLGLDHETVRKEWMENILPNVQPVPSGVFAVNRTQEHGCTYCFAG